MEAGPTVVEDQHGGQPPTYRGPRKKRAGQAPVREKWGVGGGALVSRNMDGHLVTETAAQLGLSQQRTTQLEIQALGKLRVGMSKKRFEHDLSELVPNAKVFVRALTHALAEKALADRWGLTVPEVRRVLAAVNIDPADPETWNLLC